MRHEECDAVDVQLHVVHEHENLVVVVDVVVVVLVVFVVAHYYSNEAMMTAPTDAYVPRTA